MPRPLADGFIEPKLSTIYEAPNKAEVELVYLSLFNSGTATETVIVKVVGLVDREYGMPITIGRWELDANERAQVFDSNPWLYSGDRIQATATNGLTVEFKLDGTVSSI